MRQPSAVTIAAFVAFAPWTMPPLRAADLHAGAVACFDTVRARVDRLIGVGDPGDYGLALVSAGRVSPPPAPPKRLVVLVHGLDDPIGPWRDLVPALEAEGHVAAVFRYPDDGPIASSADLLAAELGSLRAAGVERVDLVAHSMGGLVARDVLTRDEHYAGDGAGGRRFPALDRLILIGTPHHGAPLAVLRGVAEFGEHVAHAWEGRVSLFDWSEDGRGEAGADVRPGSEFLRGLNGRPLARHTRHTIIAGSVSPVRESGVRILDRTAQRLARGGNAPAWLGALAGSTLSGISSRLRAGVRGLGDGVVALDSALLPGVEDVVILEAGHVEMVQSILPADRPPPAIPVILDRLGATAPPAGPELER